MERCVVSEFDLEAFDTLGQGADKIIIGKGLRKEVLSFDVLDPRPGHRDPAQGKVLDAQFQPSIDQLQAAADVDANCPSAHDWEIFRHREVALKLNAVPAQTDVDLVGQIRIAPDDGIELPFGEDQRLANEVAAGRIRS